MAHTAPYTLKSIEEMLGLPRSVVAGLIESGFVTPSRGPRNEFRFTFQDVVLLRTAHHLKSARISSRKLLGALQQLKDKLPDEAPLTALRIRAIGNDIAVRNADAQWEAGNGQLLMDFEVGSAQGTVRFLERAPAAGPSADDWFRRGERLEAGDAAQAEAAYREALALAPGHTDASLNLGAMLCDAGRWAEALDVFERALASAPDAALLHFDRAIALEELGRTRDALKSYERCLELAPEFSDAHFNAARLHEQLGNAQGAVRHYSAYRRLQPDA